MIQVGMVTSNRTACGVRDYSERLALAIRDLEGDRVHVEVFPSRGPMKGLNAMDLFHFQFQETLYPGSTLADWIELVGDRPRFVSLHDRCVPPTFPWLEFDKVICHTESIAAQAQGDKILLPMGIPLRPLRVISFGLGRTDSDSVGFVCKELGILYDCLDGSLVWRPVEDLEDRISHADVTVLWYPEEPLAGSSFAARVALGCRRPLITNGTKWFQDLYFSQHQVASNLDELKVALRSIRDQWNRSVEGRTLRDVAMSHRDFYLQALRGSVAGVPED